MPIKKIDTSTLRQKVYEQLRKRVVGAELLPGETLSLRRLADEYGVSLLPVREAVRQLASESILLVKDNKRIEVNKLTRKEFDEVLDLRLMLESKAIREACRKRPDKAVPKIKPLLSDLVKHVGKNHENYNRINDRFHQALYIHADSPILIELIQRLLSRVNPYVFLYSVHMKDLSGAIKCHEDMFAGFAEKDEDRAQAALQKDLEEVGNILRQRLD